MKTDLIDHYLIKLYGPTAGPAAAAGLRRLMEVYRPQLPPPQPVGDRLPLDQRDAMLITYGDQVQRRTGGAEEVEPPLVTLAHFCERYARGLVSGVHILPFYPYSSDDGFSVIDYKAVDSALGSWADVERLGISFRLMFDAVINHISAQSAWFQGFLRGDPTYRAYFVVVEGAPDLSQVVRPRALPLLTRFDTATGPKDVWTTFSADQIDLNYRNPQVLLAILDTLLFYVARGAQFLRLDAIAYLWKEVGTTCIHLPRTHRVIQLFRAVLDAVAPQVMLITETNVPQVDNIAYFGDGANEAQLVYNFALPPLTLHAFHRGTARVLTEWAAGLTRPGARTTFFNFLASHDGIGLNPARGILPESEIDALVARATAHGGLVSYKHDPDGSQGPYELNINYFDALSDPAGGQPLPVQAGRFIAAQAIMLALAGVPGIYFHSLFGSRSWPAGVQETGRSRTINRQKCGYAELIAELEDVHQLRHHVYTRFAGLLRARAASAAFHPLGGQQVLDVADSVFAVLRTPPDGGERALCLHNVTPKSVRVEIAMAGLARAARDLLDTPSPAAVTRGRSLRVELEPYGVRWLGEPADSP